VLDRNEAEKIVDLIMNIYSQIGMLDNVITGIKSDEDRRRLIGAVGAIMKTSGEEILLPIFRDYPELLPKELSNNSS
jgi:hypothetical protein